MDVGALLNQPKAGPQASGLNAYTYSGNGTGGLNYFLNGKPITNTQYGAGTGSDYGALEKQASNAYNQQQQANDPYTQALQQQQAAQNQANANAAAGYDTQANNYQTSLGQLDPALQNALGNVQSSYNQTYNNVQDQFGKAQRDYNTGVANNTTNFLNTKNSIQNTTRANASALQRLLGNAGAGNSSAALEQAPYAAALQGSQNLNGAQTTYAQNQAGIDTNWGDTKDNYKKTLDNLQQQLYQNQNAAKSSIAQQRVSILGNLQQAKVNAAIARGESAATAQAQNNYTPQINELLSQITGYGNNYASPIAQQSPITYTAPTALDYSLGRNAVASNNIGGAASDINPTFLSLLTGANKKDVYGNPVLA